MLLPALYMWNYANYLDDKGGLALGLLEIICAELLAFDYIEAVSKRLQEQINEENHEMVKKEIEYRKKQRLRNGIVWGSIVGVGICLIAFYS